MPMKTPTELFREYVKGKGSAAAATLALPIKVATVHAVCSGERAISAEVAQAVELDSRGVYRAEQLRPDLDWQRDPSGSVTGYLVQVGATQPAKRRKAA